MDHILVSAKTGENVTDLFIRAARQAYKSETIPSSVTFIIMGVIEKF